MMARKKKPPRGRPLGRIDESTVAGQLGARIRAARLRRRMTIVELAAALDQPEATVRHWERGQRCLPIRMAMPMCAALGIRLGELMATE